MINKYAYIDETGNFGFDSNKPDVSTHYICTAIIVDEEDQPKLNSLIESVSNEYFNGAELKAGRLKRRKKDVEVILSKLSKADFHVITIVCDKREMYSKGLSYKSSFYKFLNNLLYKELYNAYPRLKIVNDEFGDPEYMESFVKYVKDTQYSNLFGQSDFEFVDSEDSNIVQLADIIGGIISENYDLSYKKKRISRYLTKFENRILLIKEWPYKYDKNYFSPTISDGQFDHTIAELSLNLANKYLNSHSSKSSQSEADRINCLNYLLLHFKYYDAMKYLHSAEIIDHLEELRNEKIKKRYFNSEVISKLRDSNVLLTSSQKGYKLPCTKKDLYEFVDQTSSMVLPMLWRLQNIREQVKISTTNETDILDRKEFKEVKLVIDIIYSSGRNSEKN